MSNSIPEGFHTLTPHLVVRGAAEAIDFYKKAFIDLDPAALGSDTMVKAFERMTQLRGYVDDNFSGRDWNLASAMVIEGKAGVQFMGDWAKGEFTQANQVAGRDYGCIAGFGPKSPYILQGDVFVFPKTTDAAQIRAQQLLARVVMTPATQVEFSRLKGSVPARRDADVAPLDACGQLGARLMADPEHEVGNGEMYLTPDQNGALADVLTDFWNKDVPVAEAQRRILAALRG